jgi:hypothetical protein
VKLDPCTVTRALDDDTTIEGCVLETSGTSKTKKFFESRSILDFQNLHYTVAQIE